MGEICQVGLSFAFFAFFCALQLFERASCQQAIMTGWRCLLLGGVCGMVVSNCIVFRSFFSLLDFCWGDGMGIEA